MPCPRSCMHFLSLASYLILARLHDSSTLRIVQKKAAVVLPSDILHQLRLRGLEQQCLLGNGSLQAWWQGEKDNVYLDAIGREFVTHLPYPLMFHEDGVPTTRNETMVFWSWSCALTDKNSEISRFCCSSCIFIKRIVSRNLPILFRFSTSVHISTCEEGIIGIPQSRVSDETRRFMAELISWDLESLRAAQFANRDWLGQEWPRGSWRQKMIGRPLPRAAFAYWKGDQEAHLKSHFLSRAYNRRYICDWCLAMSSGTEEPLNFADFSYAAFWRTTQEQCMAVPFTPETSPWISAPGYFRRRRMFD